MVVNQIDLPSVAFLEAEYDAPVGPNRHTPEIFLAAFEAVQSEARQVQVFGPARATQYEEDVLHLFDLIRADTFALAIFKQSFQTFMAETPDHVVIFPITAAVEPFCYDKQ